MKCIMIEKEDKYIFECIYNSGVIEVKKEFVTKAIEYLKELRQKVCHDATSHIESRTFVAHNHVYGQHIDYAIQCLTGRACVTSDLLQDIKDRKIKISDVSLDSLKVAYDMVKGRKL